MSYILSVVHSYTRLLSIADQLSCREGKPSPRQEWCTSLLVTTGTKHVLRNLASFCKSSCLAFQWWFTKALSMVKIYRNLYQFHIDKSISFSLFCFCLECPQVEIEFHVFSFSFYTYLFGAGSLCIVQGVSSKMDWGRGLLWADFGTSEVRKGFYVTPRLGKNYF